MLRYHAEGIVVQCFGSLFSHGIWGFFWDILGHPYVQIKKAMNIANV